MFAAQDAGSQTITSWATAISAGPVDKVAQTLHFNLSVDHPECFAKQPAISAADGTLTFTPATNANGITVVEVTLQNNG